MWFLLIVAAAWVGGYILLEASANADEERERRRAIGKLPERVRDTGAIDVEATAVVPYTGNVFCTLSIPLEREVFTPPLPEGKHFKLVFSGSVAVKFHAWHGVSACYRTDNEQYNYTKRHHALHLDGKAVFDEPIEQDRHEHRYVFPYHANGGRLSVLLECPVGNLRNARVLAQDVIQLAVVQLTWTEVLMHGLDAEARQREADERYRQEVLTKKAVEWATWAHLEKNFLDAKYQQQFAARHKDKILNKFEQEWLNEYQQLLSNEPLYTRIQSEHPHVLEILEARLEVVRIAQRLAVEPAPEPPAPEPKPRLTREQWEARIERHRQRMLDRLTVKAEDHIARMLQQFEAAQLLRQRAEEMGLDEDIIERLEQQLVGDLDQDDDAGSFKQV